MQIFEEKTTTRGGSRLRSTDTSTLLATTRDSDDVFARQTEPLCFKKERGWVFQNKNKLLQDVHEDDRDDAKDASSEGEGGDFSSSFSWPNSTPYNPYTYIEHIC